MSMPSGDTPQKAQQYYHYLQSHQLAPHGRVATWHVDWDSLAWLWGFVSVLVLLILIWVRTHLSTRQAAGIFPAYTWGGHTTEAAGPAAVAFFFITFVVFAFGAESVIAHLI